jgi:dihydrofolate synthase/folylpolyglutamate synthase
MTKPASDPWVYSSNPEVETKLQHIAATFPPMLPAGLQRIYPFLQSLGNPHLKLPPVFHVAGTNGKGSTLAFLQAIFEAGGKTVHKFTSPHLVEFRERIVLNGKMIEEDFLLTMIDECEKAAKGHQVSFFEFFTVLSFLAFSRYPADAVLLETGLGGLLDATNVIEKNAVTILTRISFDHTHILGPSLIQIAQQKAGIIKEGCPVIIAPQSDAGVMEVFIREAEKKNAPVVTLTAEEVDETFQYGLPLPSLAGRHQMINATTAIAAAEAARYHDLLKMNRLSRAMTSVDWPGRMQKLNGGKLAALLPEGWELWIDGAHNDSGAEVLLEHMQEWQDEKPVHILTAFKSRKDIAGFYKPLVGHARTVTVLADDFGAPMMAPHDLVSSLSSLGFPVSLAENLERALGSLVFQFDQPQRILVTGSLYLVGRVLRENTKSS